MLQQLIKNLINFDTISKESLFYENVQLKLDNHLKYYYTNLQRNLEKVYEQVLTKNIMKNIQEVNLQLLKNKKKKLGKGNNGK